jgi:histidine ammonia-lyase
VSADTAQPVLLNGALDPDALAAIADGAPLALDPDALERVAANRATLERLVDAGTPVYGITTGFGALVSERVPVGLEERLQVNLLRSHAAGSGEPLPRAVVRAALATRVNGLLGGHSGVRPVVLEAIVALLNGGCTPTVPASGSLGASGDLAPSAHAVLPLIGEGHVEDPDGRVLTGAAALERLGLAPLRLRAKEGLALINGTHFMSAIGALLVVRVRRLLDTADVVAAMTVDALRGSTAAFDPRVHALRPLPGQGRSAANIARALAGSARTDADGAVQDAYSLRCAPQVHGAAREAHGFLAGVVECELNAVTDNPLVFAEAPHVVSAGNFHGQALALALDALRLGLADLGSISERRTFRLVSPSLNGRLPAFLSPTPGSSSGYMIAQYAAAALVSELRALAHAVSVDSVPTSDNQEDHVSMGMTAATMAWRALDCLERVIAWELLCAAQALDCDPGRPGELVAVAHAAVRERVTELGEDRPPADDLAALRPLVASGALAALLADGVAAEALV